MNRSIPCGYSTWYKKWVLNLDDKSKGYAFPAEGSYEQALAKIAKDKENILAQNRGLLPIKTQHAKQTKFVNQLVADLEAVKKGQCELLAKWQELANDIQSKEQALAIKRAELAELAAKVAEENAVAPKDTEASCAKNQNKQQHLEALGFGEEDLKGLQILMAAMANSNIQEVLKQQGAINHDFTKLGLTCQKFGDAISPTGSPPSQDACTKREQALADGASQLPARKSPGQEDMQMDEDLERLWQEIVNSRSELQGLDEAELAKRKGAWVNIQSQSKHARTTPY